MTPGASTFLNRELSWLEFNQRVLNEALDPDVPLLERLNFLAITGSNLDEFFMVRAGGLELIAERGIRKRDAAGMTPMQQLAAIRRRVQSMVRDQYDCYLRLLEPALAAEGIRRLTVEALTPEQADHLDRYFEARIFPVVTPMIVDPDAPPTIVTHLRLVLVVRLAPAAKGRASRYALLPLAPDMPRFVTVPSDAGRCCVAIEDVIKPRLYRYFTGQDVRECVAIRIARNADLVAREDFTDDFLSEMERILRYRKESACIRLEVESNVSRILLSFLERLLAIKPRHVYKAPGPLDVATLRGLAGDDGHERLRYKPWLPQPHPDVPADKSMFEILRQRDLLLSHPYDAYDPIPRLLREASEDPDVLAIKQILYRTSANSPIIAALQTAAENGKHVTVLVELKARFDEARNIAWARELERAGAQVIYGIRGYKTHAKLLIVVRREPNGIARYLHFGTGNYNERTARQYSDISYMTANPELGADASLFFNAIAGYSNPLPYQHLYASPQGIKARLLELIDNETERKRQGQKALILAKVNSLVDRDIIKALYRASRAGVEIKLNVRGVCCLRPGIPGLSETITVVSIVDRFLEHSRIAHFHHGGQGLTYISSADWMPRNLERRIELMVPIDRPELRSRLLDTLKTYFKDNMKSSLLNPDGTYSRPTKPGSGRPRRRSQELLYRRAVANASAASGQRERPFDPLKPVADRSR